jgi:hypothetical protein
MLYDLLSSSVENAPAVKHWQFRVGGIRGIRCGVANFDGSPARDADVRIAEL